MGEACCCSDQELLLRELAGGGDNPHRKEHPRLFAILDTFDGMTPVIDVQRGRLFTESMRRTEGQPLVLRWAKALKHIAEHITVYVEPMQLVVGRCGTDAGRYGILYPELNGDFMDESLRSLAHREASPLNVSEEDVRIAAEEIAPYWKGRTFHEALNRSLPPEAHRLAYNDEKGYSTRFVVSETASYRSSLQWVPDYAKVLGRGFSGIREEAEARLAALNPLSPVDRLRRKPFLEAVILTCEAVVLWARRHAELARRKAEIERDPVRRAELALIAENCERVPEFPARNFYEAVQAHWFTQAFSRLEQRTGSIVSNGRMDQLLWPYYRKDREEGRITPARALEIFDCLWLQMAQFTDLTLSSGAMATKEGYAHWEAVTIGGQTREGFDATNELSYLILESRRVSPMPYPDLAVRIHARSPQRFLWEVAETIKVGQGYPKLFNDEEIIPLHLAKGAPEKDIFDYSASGCAEIRMPNRDTLTSAGCQVNLGAVLEMTLRNGRMKKHGSELLGLETGDPRMFSDWEAFWSAFVAQLNNCLSFAFADTMLVHRLRAEHFATPLSSALHDLCMASCRDLHTSEKIEGGLDLGFNDLIGFATVVDALAAVKKLVYEDGKVGMDELMQALDSNFEGMEALRRLLESAPRFGNGDPYADEIGRRLDRAAQEYCRTWAGETGIRQDIRTVSVTANVPHGKEVGALPNGRRDWMPLSDGSSPVQGADMKGPTASLMSSYASKNRDYNERAARLLNLKLSPSCIAGEEGTANLVGLIRTFCDLRLWHVQFNVINRETMLAAQEDPRKYRGLIVRIAGYSAYFTELSHDLQDDLIARTEHSRI